MTWLILALAADEAAQWAYDGLGERGLDPLELVTAEELASALHWRQHLGRTGTETRVELADGRVIESGGVKGALNRIVVPAPPPITFPDGADRRYSEQEVYALYLSWLASLPGIVVNRPDGRCLVGGFRHPAEWAVLAARAGLPVAAYRFNTSEPARAGARPFRGSSPSVSTFAIGGSVVGPLVDPHIIQGCCRLAAEVAILLGITFAANEGRWVFAGASPVPDLRRGGNPLLDALAAVLKSGHT